MNHKKTICIIDDDDIYKYALSRIIKLCAFADNIIEFANGADALDFFKKERADAGLPDIIFLDIDMPLLDGWQFLDEFAPILQKITKKIKIYMVSSSSNDYDIIRARRSTMLTDYITKPITADKLYNIMGEAGTLPPHSFTR